MTIGKMMMFVIMRHSDFLNRFDRAKPPKTDPKLVKSINSVDIAIAELEQKLTNVKNAKSQRRYADQLGKFQPGQPIAVAALLQLMSSTLFTNVRRSPIIGD